MKIRETGMNTTNEIASQEKTFSLMRGKETVGEESLSLTPDSVQISTEGVKRARFQQVLSAVMDAPDIDRNKVAGLKKAIAEGSYKPSAMDVAQKIAEEWSINASLYVAGGADHGDV